MDLVNIDRRYQPGLTIRASQAGKATKISGYAALFNQLSEDLGGFVEKIAPGAFLSSLGADVRALWNHNADFPLGRTRSKTLAIWEDAQGLAFELDLPNTQAGRDLLELIKRGDVAGCSFGFRATRDAWEKTPEGKPLRVLLDINLIDISPVTFPAYPQTSVAARSWSGAAKTGAVYITTATRRSHLDFLERQRW